MVRNIPTLPVIPVNSKESIHTRSFREALDAISRKKHHKLSQMLSLVLTATPGKSSNMTSNLMIVSMRSFFSLANIMVISITLLSHNHVWKSGTLL
jgi:hypothetical protein